MPKKRYLTTHDRWKFLRAWRLSRNYTLKTLAEKLAKGVSTVSGWETGGREVDLADLNKLADVYGVHPAALLLAPSDAVPIVDDMREAGSLAKGMDETARAEWLALGRRLVGKITPD